MEKLYRKMTLKNGSKRYVPTIKGKRWLLFKRADDAQAHSLKVRARYHRLKQAEYANRHSQP